jgi:acyl carrier protein
MSDVATRVRRIVAKKFGLDVEQLVPDASIITDLGADSLDVVEISMALEKEFGIEIFDDDIENIRTLGELEHFVEAKV